MYGYIYKITNKLNNKIYIGRHKAKAFDSKYWGSGVVIKKVIAAYGVENFKVEIITWAKNNKELNDLEVKYIADYNATNPNIGYNLTIGGDAIMANRVKVIKGSKVKFIDEAYLSLFLDAGWERPDDKANRAAATARWRQKNKAKVKAYRKAHRKRHPEKLAEQNKRYREKHKEQLQEYYKQYWKDHK